jgi:hypothetical protein
VKAVEGLGGEKLRYCNKSKVSVHCNYLNTEVLVNMRRLVGSCTFDLAAKLQLLHFGPQLLAAIWNSDQYLSPASSQLCRLLCINSFFGVPFLHEQKCSRIFSLLFSKALFGAVEQKMQDKKKI